MITETLLTTKEGKLMLLAACGQAFAGRNLIVADAADAITKAEVDAALSLFAKVGNRLEVMADCLSDREAQADCYSLSCALRHLLTGDDETSNEE